MFEIRYTPYPPTNPEARYRPMLRVSLVVNGVKKEPDLAALVDSGSDRTISYAVFARSMGVDFEDRELIKKVNEIGWKFTDYIEGVGREKIEVHITPVDLMIGGHLIKDVQMHWIKHPFSPGSDFPVMLGQDTVFQRFDVHFNRRRLKFFLNEHEFNPDGTNILAAPD